TILGPKYLLVRLAREQLARRTEPMRRSRPSRLLSRGHLDTQRHVPLATPRSRGWDCATHRPPSVAGSRGCGPVDRCHRETGEASRTGNARAQSSQADESRYQRSPMLPIVETPPQEAVRLDTG